MLEWPPPRVLAVAELSANAALHDLDYAKRLVEVAAKSGADAVKTQCFTPEDMTLPGQPCTVGPWKGRDLFDLYRECAMPLDWHAELKRTADDLGVVYFASVFQPWHVDYMQGVGVPCFKVASFEVDHVPLLERIAETGKPCMYSLGTARADDRRIPERTVTQTWGIDAPPWFPMYCVSAYPAAPSGYPLDVMEWERDDDVAHEERHWYGLSDHTLGSTVAIAATALGARVIEKHFTLSRADGGPDAAFSAEPEEFAAMVEAVRVVEAALEPSEEPKPHPLRRGLWVTRDVKAGEAVEEAVAILRPAAALTPVDWAEVKGKRFARDVKRGEALTWEVVE